MLRDALSHSVVGRGLRNEAFNVELVDIRNFSNNKHRKVDDYPYGGGPGMVMQAPPVLCAYKQVAAGLAHPRTLITSPRGRVFNQTYARELTHERDIVIICGHYEGVDERVMDIINPEAVSIGDFILTGGEIVALSIIDATARLLPGVLGNDNSGIDESFSLNLLEYPQYTRPPLVEGLPVPEVLLSGNHGEIEKWRQSKSLELTLKNRPDLLR